MITDISLPSLISTFGGNQAFPAPTRMDEVWVLDCCQQGPLLGRSFAQLFSLSHGESVCEFGL